MCRSATTAAEKNCLCHHHRVFFFAPRDLGLPSGGTHAELAQCQPPPVKLLTLGGGDRSLRLPFTLGNKVHSRTIEKRYNCFPSDSTIWRWPCQEQIFTWCVSQRRCGKTLLMIHKDFLCNTREACQICGTCIQYGRISMIC